MEPTYKIIGGDGKEYGPVSLSQLKTWIGEGRVDGESRVMRADQSTWAPASSLTELSLTSASDASAAPPLPAPPPSPTATAPGLDQLRLANAARSGAGWFYWIAGLSLINSALTLFGPGGGFVIGLGITQVFDVLGSGMGGAGRAVVMVLDLLAAGLFVLFGAFAARRHAWAFVLGMILYSLDALIFVHFRLWFSVGFHVFALFCIFGGFSANQKLKALNRA
jgi:hypothetical protein